MKLRQFSLLFLLCVCLQAVADNGTTPAWQKFAGGDEDNVLLDFSAAGYDHGNSLPAELTLEEYEKNGYTVYNVCDYGAVPDDDVSDSAALAAIIKKINKKTKAMAVIYFPAGRYVLHAANDDVNGVSSTIMLNSGYVVLKGAGRNKTTIAMTAPMQPVNPSVLYSSPVMLTVKNNGGGTDTLAKVTSKAKINDWKVTVDTPSALSPGQWVCLYLKNKNKDAIDAEVGYRTIASAMTNIKAGVEVTDYHQVDKIDGNEVYFKEPVMKAMRDDDEWIIRKWRCYSNVGLEDFTFEGKAKEKFGHHNSWEDDGAYKPLLLMRLVDSWVRRVDFKSVSECITFEECANVSCYDVEISGNRGHSAIRMANTSRGFIGCVYDHSDGYLTSDKNYTTRLQGLGQYHAVGVSKHSIGNVIWKCRWGIDACFESHATQPRASLFDVCEGGFMQYRMGGAKEQLPNHLDNLTIWNFNCTKADESSFRWWHDNGAWIKVMPPTIVGMHGEKVVWYDESEIKLNENEGQTVSPYSLYKAQLEKRLGSVPVWMNTLEALNSTTADVEKVVISGNRSVPGIYNLSGQRMGNEWNSLPSGVYIVSGRKVLK